MATPENIQRFNEAVGRTLAILYEEFPRRITLRSGQVMGLDVNEEDDACDGSPIPAVDVDGNSTSVTYRDLELGCQTVQWLADSGYLYVKQISPPFFIEGVTLSAKGLELLKCVPSSVNDSASFGDELQTLAKSSGKDALSSAVSTALTTGFKLLVS